MSLNQNGACNHSLIWVRGDLWRSLVHTHAQSRASIKSCLLWALKTPRLDAPALPTTPDLSHRGIAPNFSASSVRALINAPHCPEIATAEPKQGLHAWWHLQSQRKEPRELFEGSGPRPSVGCEKWRAGALQTSPFQPAMLWTLSPTTSRPPSRSPRLSYLVSHPALFSPLSVC